MNTVSLPEKMTIGECYGPAMECETQAAADAWFAALVERDMRCLGKSQEEAERTQRANIGYYSGYYDTPTARKVFRLFCCAHPIFGTARPSAEDALDAGKRLAAKGQSANEGA